MSTATNGSGRHTSADTIVMPARPRGERRGSGRVLLPKPLPATFSIGTTYYKCALVNVSPTGGRFRLDVGMDPPLKEGVKITVVVVAPWETTAREGNVVWVGPIENERWFGLEFPGISPDSPCLGLLDVDRLKVDPVVALRIPATLALRRQVLPFGVQNGSAHVACANPADAAALHAVEKALGMPVLAEAADPGSLRRVLDRIYGDSPAATGSARSIDVRGGSIDIRGFDQSPDPVAIGDEVLRAALLRQASDVHLDPEPDGLLVRLRVDGELEVFRKLPTHLAVGVLSRFKVLAGMDIAEKRAPQDGGFKHSYGKSGARVDVRVATIPTRYGERMTIRLLALQTESLTLEKLGLREHDHSLVERYLAKPHGMTLLTGPTGSGKSTTLYAALRRLMAMESLNILTVEDPIEYEIRGVAQVEVDSADKVSFSNALRSVLRHDPDVVMIGEIRDQETASVAVKASLTGHLVLSTLHTNSAVSVVTRLADMGVERYLIAATLRLAVAQRLVRQLCPRCRSPRPMTVNEAAALARPERADRIVYDAVGCVYCGGKGTMGRLGLFELLPLDEDWSRLIAGGADEASLVRRMRELGMPTLLDDGLAKLESGITSPRDVIAAVTVW